MVKFLEAMVVVCSLVEVVVSSVAEAVVGHWVPVLVEMLVELAVGHQVAVAAVGNWVVVEVA